ncbi:hypothetical protein [Neptuniibacter sp.]|uniref:hypothetical protein n=1 Tax=Neptuniibacter sp. TaxID=1962643 RepID=UPI00262514D7|nr:hypothetical protein [Neptuniibacter sp.]MCP4596130.1 hypothetical protein [Neptuniibacter sp.]
MKYLPLPVVIIAGTVLCTQISFSLFDAAWGDASSENNLSEQPTLSTAQISSLLAVADPTDILEPTAAGETGSAATCRTGKIVAEDHPDSHHDSYYVAYKEDGSLYIQVSPLVPTFLRQDKNQIVSASVFTPTPEIASRLSNLFANRDDCDLADLYLNQIKNVSHG